MTLYGITGGIQRQKYLAVQQLDREWETKRLALRQMLHTFKKQEFKLRRQIRENPTDHEAEYRLMDLMAIKALQQGNTEEAIAIWKKVLELMPKQQNTEEMRTRIVGNLKNL